jgi:phage tail protein X
MPSGGVVASPAPATLPEAFLPEALTAPARSVTAETEPAPVEEADVPVASLVPSALPADPGTHLETDATAGPAETATAGPMDDGAVFPVDGAGDASNAVSRENPAVEESSRDAPLPSFWEVQVPRGAGLRALARQVYGDDSAEILARIQRANPQIADVDRLLAGDVLQFPEPPAGVMQEPTGTRVREVRVPAGVGLRALARTVYGSDSESIINQIKKMNPQITDADHILAGDLLRFPDVTEHE